MRSYGEWFFQELLGDPLEEADDAHGCASGVGGDFAGAGFDLLALFGVVAVGLDHHLLVRDGGSPAEALADSCGVELEVFGDHAVVVGAEGAYA